MPTTVPGPVKSGLGLTADLPASQKISAGSTVGVYWRIPTELNDVKNWFGLFRVDDHSPYDTLIQPIYTNNVAVDHANATIPAYIAPGMYQFILFKQGATDHTPVYLTQSQGFYVTDSVVDAWVAVRGAGIGGYVPGGELYTDYHLETPHAGDMLDIVPAGASTSQSAATYTDPSGNASAVYDGRRTVPIPSGLTQGYYEVVIFSGSGGAVVARSEMFFVTVTNSIVDAAIVRVWDSIRNNGSSQRFNYTRGPAASNNVVKIVPVGSAEGVTPTLSVTLPNSAGSMGLDVYADVALTTSNISPGTYVGRLYIAGSSARSCETAPFTVTT
jgi:hypothetical protein